ncbi:MAG: ABC transporter permease [Spirochaetes bacterium]|nr:MAG: ABC transporter permease [Spirochaetota bacterium]
MTENVQIKERKSRRFNLSQSMILILLIVLLSIIATVVNPNFIRFTNLINILQQIAVLGIVASGVGMLLVSGEIDISVGSQVSLMGVILAMTIQKMLGLPEGNVAQWRQTLAIPFAVFITFAVGFVLGLINGITVIKSKAHSFIITLGFMLAYKGVALLTTGGASYMLFGTFETLGRGRVLHFIPIPVLFLIGIILVTHIILKYFRYGRFLYAVGDNRKAAYVSGINTNRITVTAYIVVGLLDALAALILISRVGSALATTGDPYALDALAAVIVGGVSILGGKGNALSIFLGVVLIGLIGNALIIMNVNPYVRDVVIGLIIIIAVSIGQFSTQK